MKGDLSALEAWEEGLGWKAGLWHLTYQIHKGRYHGSVILSQEEGKLNGWEEIKEL